MTTDFVVGKIQSIEQSRTSKVIIERSCGEKSIVNSHSMREYLGEYAIKGFIDSLKLLPREFCTIEK